MLGLGPLWGMLKSLYYLIPFLREVTDEKVATDDEDLRKIRELKSLIRSVIWWFIYLCLTVLVFWFGVIPTYSQNAVMRLEIDKQNTRIHQLTLEVKIKDNDLRKLRNELVSLENDIKYRNNEYNRLFENLKTSHQRLDKYREWVLSGKEGERDNSRLPDDVRKLLAENDKSNLIEGNDRIKDETRTLISGIEE